jgi:streptogramin lyase
MRANLAQKNSPFQALQPENRILSNVAPFLAKRREVRQSFWRFSLKRPTASSSPYSSPLNALEPPSFCLTFPPFLAFTLLIKANRLKMPHPNITCSRQSAFRNCPPGLVIVLGLFLCWQPGTLRAESFAITTIAGVKGMRASMGDDDGTNKAAKFYGPTGMTVDAAGNVFVADGNAIRKVTPSGTNWIVTTIAGIASFHGYVDGTNANAQFNGPQGLAVDSSGTIYVADTLNDVIRKIVPIGTNWVVTTIAGNLAGIGGNADGTNFQAQFDHPYGITIGASSTLYVADTFNNTIRQLALVGTNRVVTTIAGQTNVSGSADGTNTSTLFNFPSDVEADATGRLFVTDFANNTVRMLFPSSTNWVSTTLAGLAGAIGAADGSNSVARFYHPRSLALDAAGRIYVTDNGNNTVRIVKQIGTNWVVNTIAGSPGPGGGADGIGSTARFNGPVGIAMDNSGKLFVNEAINLTLRLGQLAVVLNLNTAADKVVFSWPMAATGYGLVTNTSLTGGTWHSLPGSVTYAADTCFVTNTPKGPATFFRLYKP